MNDSLKTQMDIKNNAQDLRNYILDLNNWEEEIKKKEMRLNDGRPTHSDLPPPRNKIKRNKPTSEKSVTNTKAKRISAYDYSAWDKYDVDKACAELEEDNTTEAGFKETTNKNDSDSVDENRNHDEDDEDKLTLIDKALYEKDLGNQYVKKEQWDNAIRCYTNAMNYDSKNPIYYANRSLCFLKSKNFRAAEADATTAIQLDTGYVKAYQRRGFARLELGQHAEAKSDFEEVLRIEPKNSLMRLEISKIDKKLNKLPEANLPKTTFNPKNIFKKKEIVNSAKPSKPNETSKEGVKTLKKSELEKSPETIDKDKKEVHSLGKSNINLDKGDGDKEIPVGGKKMAPSVFIQLPEYCNIIYPVQKPPHKRSKKPLMRIKVVDAEEEKNVEEGCDGLQCSPNSSALHVREFDIEAVDCNAEKNKEFIVEQNYSLDVPKTSVQFRNSWRILKNKPEEAFKYLKIISRKLPNIFENSLESDIFSDLLTFLASDHEEKHLSVVYTLLLNLANVNRFGSMILFMSNEDKACVKKCISELKSIKSETEISELRRLYEM